MKTVNLNGDTLKLLLSMSPVILVIVYPISVVFILFCFKEVLGVPHVRDSIGQFYNNVDLKKGDWAL